jgi:hypothetical protein
MQGICWSNLKEGGEGGVDYESWIYTTNAQQRQDGKWVLQMRTTSTQLWWCVMIMMMGTRWFDRVRSGSKWSPGCKVAGMPVHTLLRIDSFCSEANTSVLFLVFFLYPSGTRPLAPSPAQSRSESNHARCGQQWTVLP